MSFSLSASSLSVHHLSLNNAWKMRQVGTERWYPAIVPGCVHSDLLKNQLIDDPYYRTNEKKLQWIDKKDWEYQTTFDLSEEFFRKKNKRLVFKGLDTYADVYLNGKQILVADNMFKAWTVDVCNDIKKQGNELRVYFHSPINKGIELLKNNGFGLPAPNDQATNGGLQSTELLSPFIRKAPYHFGWDWGPRFVTSGIWLPVELQAFDCFKIDDLFLQQDELTDRQASLTAELSITSQQNQQATVSIYLGDKIAVNRIVELKQGANSLRIPFVVHNPKRWWTNGLGDPFLYTVKAEVRVDKVVDEYQQKIGLRTLKLINKPDDKGHSFYFELNGVPVFAKGENHIPNDMFLDRVTDDVYKWEIQTAVQSNINMLRVWGGGIYEKDRFYDLCDEYGILVWQDFMFACSMYPGNNTFLTSVRDEAEYQVKRLRNHPSIALWCGNNEMDVAWQNFSQQEAWGWKKLYTEEQKKLIWTAYDSIFNHILPDVVKHETFHQPYIHSSPLSVVPQKHANDRNTDGDVHYWGVWWGKHPFEKYDDNIGRFMSEYGFQSFPELSTVKKYALPEDYNIESEVMRHHQRSSIGNVTIKEYMDKYYRQPATFEKFLYVGQVLQAYGIQHAIEAHRRAMPYNMGSLVWQINDCWPVASWSSCDYFHNWKALQYEIKRSFAPVILSVFEKEGVSSVSIVSDLQRSLHGEIELEVSDFRGNITWTDKRAVSASANAVTEAMKIATSVLTKHPEKTYLKVIFRSQGKEIANKVYFFTAPKNLELQTGTASVRMQQQSDVWVLYVKSEVLLKDLFIQFPGVEGTFTDNYFDLLPGEEKTIIFKPKGKKVALGNPQCLSLVDSYR